jgi:hypothetical protein
MQQAKQENSNFIANFSSTFKEIETSKKLVVTTDSISYWENKANIINIFIFMLAELYSQIKKHIQRKGRRKKIKSKPS